MAQTLLKNGYIVTMGANETVYDGGSVLVEDDKIIAVGVGSLISFIVGSGIKLVAGGFMMYYIWTDAFHIIQEAW